MTENQVRELGMAFDGLQTKMVYSLFPPFNRQASVNDGGGNNCGSLPFSDPGASLQEHDTTSYVPWSHNAQDDPYGLISYALSSTKNRIPSDNTACYGEAYLQGLVSNIVDEADSQDGYLNEGNPPTCNPVWSQKALREELLQYFQSDVKTQYNPMFPLNHVYCKDLSKGQGQSADQHAEDMYQMPSGNYSQQWLFNLPARDGDSYTVYPQKLPPGLPVPNAGNAFLSQTEQTKYEGMSADEDARSCMPLKNFTDLSDVFQPQSAANGPYLNPYYEDHYIQSSAEPIDNEQYKQQDMNQLVRGLQSFMASNPHSQTLGLDQKGITAEQWKVPSPVAPTQMNAAVHAPKHSMGKSGTVQMKRQRGLRNQALNCHVPEFSTQNTDYFQQPKSYTGSIGFPNLYQNKMRMHGERGSLPVPAITNQYSKHRSQQGQLQSKFQPKMQKEKKKMTMSGFVEEFPTRNKQPHPKNLDQSGDMRSQKIHAENGTISAGNTQQPVYSAGDPRNLSCGSTADSGGYFPGGDIGGMISSKESAALKSLVSGMMTQRAANPYHGVASDMMASMWLDGGRPSIQFYFYLNECNEQWKCLEKDRKMTEAVLNKAFPSKRTMAVVNAVLPKTPPNATIIDHLIVNEMREQGRVEGLLRRMELLNNIPFHINIHTVLNKQRMAVSCLRVNWLRQKEKDSMYKHQLQSTRFMEDKETQILVIALKDLSATTRRLRTALWIALQITLPKPVKKQDQHDNREDVETETSPLVRGFSFKL